MKAFIAWCVLVACALSIVVGAAVAASPKGTTGSCSAQPNPVGQHAYVTLNASGLTPGGTYLLSLAQGNGKASSIALFTADTQGSISYTQNTDTFNSGPLVPGQVHVSFTGAGGSGTHGKASCDFTVVANERPVAVLQASPLSGPGPLTVSVDGTASHDPDGTVVAYRWSFGSSGGPTTPTAEYTFQSVFDPETHERVTTTYIVRLNVWDNLGAESNTFVTVTVD